MIEKDFLDVLLFLMSVMALGCILGILILIIFVGVI